MQAVVAAVLITKLLEVVGLVVAAQAACLMLTVQQEG
jgi:hypothetical protein